jgi:hypothetical protein
VLESESAHPGVMPRCIYTGVTLVPGDQKLKPSREHIVPVALGGSDSLVTTDVSADANSRAGHDIDDEVAGLLPFAMLRNQYGLKGNRRTVPKIILKGYFEEIPGVGATLEFDSDAGLSVHFQGEQIENGQVIQIGSTADRIRFLLNARLKQARTRNRQLLTQFGPIKDEEDIEISLLLAPRTQGRQFRSRLSFDLAAYHHAMARLMIKMALGLGHRVLGPTWTFSPSGDLLRRGLWSSRNAKEIPPILGSLTDGTSHPLRSHLGIGPGKHVMAVLPVERQTVALIALFGGAMGVATINLGVDSLEFFENGADAARGGCVFEITMGENGSKHFSRRTFQQLANDSAARGSVVGDTTEGAESGKNRGVRPSTSEKQGGKRERKKR